MGTITSTLRAALPLALLLAPLPSAAQSGDCPAALRFVADRVSGDYAGFETKVTPETRPSLDSATAAAERDAAGAATEAACLGVVSRWLGWFRDGHLSISSTAPRDAGDTAAAAIRARFAGWERMDVTGDAVRTGTRDPLEGVWESADGRYRLAVLPHGSDGELAAVVLRADSVWWTPGQVKAVYRPAGEGAYETRFFLRDHSEQRFTSHLARGLLVGPVNAFTLRQVSPAPADALAPAEYAATLNTAFAARQVEPGTVLLQIPNFDNSRSATIDSLFAASAPLLRNARTLIVDLRGNGGGSDYNYRHLLPLLYTRPIVTVGAQARATPGNVAAYEALLTDSGVPDGVKGSIRNSIAEMRRYLGGWTPRRESTTRFRRPLPHPERVAVIVDGGCASTCEQFVLAARQSAKTTLFGARTAGVLDFANVISVPVPGTRLVLHQPTSRSGRLPADPVDPLGIAPAVPIPPGELFPVDWVRRWLAAHPSPGR
ncbi:S41 family peptidase [Longimicrobium sp.]|uniref:S41 family peptidase n=1 Tax=Longimicrobium sp. TaxID=2029185 RepID=UPI002CDFB730|nr:S41 family peptidase [Longimicrobium sp.]HSU17775.1 S41 family peptidase [Longimicrobium sp.]